MSRNEPSCEIYKFYVFSLCPCENCKFYRFYVFSCGGAKIAEFTIFRYRSLRISQIFSPFVMLVKTNWELGTADFTKFAKIVDFTILTIFHYSNYALQILQIFFSLCHVNYNTSAKRYCGLYKICENCGFCNDFFNDFSLPRSCDVNIPRSLRNKGATHQYTSFDMNIPGCLKEQERSTSIYLVL